MIFDDNEKLIVSTLFRSGSLLVSELAEQAGLPRTAVYRPLRSLESEGLILRSKTTGGDRFSAISKEQYDVWKKKKLAELGDDLDALGSPCDRAQEILQKPEVYYFLGEESVKNLYHDSWRNNPEALIYAITDYDQAYNTLGEFMRQDYFPERIRRGVYVKSILPRSESGEIDRKKQKELLREMRFVKGLEDIGLEINIYGDRVSLVQFGGPQPVGVLVVGGVIAEAFKKVFGGLWQLGRKR